MIESFKRAQAEQVFGAENMLSFGPEMLPASITHEPTRRFLVSIGLPTADAQGLVVPDQGLPTRIRSLPESRFFVEFGWDVPAGCEEYLLLGELQAAVSGVIALNGDSGQVDLISELDVTTPELLNSDVARLVYFLYVLRRDEHTYSADSYHGHRQPQPGSQEPDTFGQAADRIRQELQRVDAAAFEPSENIWESVLEDISTGTWS